jgi:hypothetical protein
LNNRPCGVGDTLHNAGGGFTDAFSDTLHGGVKSLGNALGGIEGTGHNGTGDSDNTLFDISDNWNLIDGFVSGLDHGLGTAAQRLNEVPERRKI